MVDDQNRIRKLNLLIFDLQYFIVLFARVAWGRAPTHLVYPPHRADDAGDQTERRRLLRRRLRQHNHLTDERVGVHCRHGDERLQHHRGRRRRRQQPAELRHVAFEQLARKTTRP